MDSSVCTYCHHGRMYFYSEEYGEESDTCKACGGTGQFTGFRKYPERLLLGKYKSIEEWIEGEITPTLPARDAKFGLTSIGHGGDGDLQSLPHQNNVPLLRHVHDLPKPRKGKKRKKK